MGLYRDHFLPRMVDWVMRGRPFSELRAKYLGDLSGTVLEVGFGSGLNLPHYPDAVERLLALDPARLGRRLGRQRIQRFRRPVEFIDWHRGALGLPDHAVDAVVTTWTLCTLPDPASALEECRRVLKPGGIYVFVEHGKAPDRWVSRLQDGWNPFQKCLAGGCHVNRPMDRLIEGACFRFERLDRFYMDGPRIFSYMYCGRALRD